MPRHIALLTDFGIDDPYVGQMKGALLRDAPDAVLVDISHQVLPGNIVQAGFFLAASAPHFPEEAIFVAVVDPGVGTARRILLAEVGRQSFLAPDNGLLTQLLKGKVAEVRVVTAFGRHMVSATFHGRDVFARLAARLANGESPSALGESIDPDSLVQLSGAQPVLAGDVLTATVLHVDRFGNCLLNLDAHTWAARLADCRRLHLKMVARSARPQGPASEDLPPQAVTASVREPGSLPLQAAACMSDPAAPSDAPATQPASSYLPLQPVATYADLTLGAVGILAGSQGVLELAVNQGSAAEVLGLAPDGAVTIVLDGLA